MTNRQEEICIMKLSELTDTQPQRDHGDISDLKESICKLGLLEPLVVTPVGKLIAGRRRFQALTELEINDIPVRIVRPANKYEEFIMSWDENRCRKAETWQEEARSEHIEQKLYEELFPETKHGGDRKSEKYQDAEAASCSPTYAEAKAKVTGESKRTIQEHVQLAEIIEEHPELAEKHTAKAALSEYRRMKRQETVREKAQSAGVEYSLEIVCCDAVEYLTRFEPESVQLIFTDPPYNISSSRKITKLGSEIAEAQFGDWDQVTEEEYYRLADGIAREAARVLAPTGSIYFFCDRILVSDVWRIFETAGLNPKNVIAWRKTNPVPHARRNFASAWESVVWAVKSSDYTWNEKATQDMHNVYESPICGGRERENYPHPTAKPSPLCRHFIEISSNPGDIVVDCFCGSGSTIEAAVRTRRKWRGCDKDERYCETTRLRAAETIKELRDDS